VRVKKSGHSRAATTVFPESSALAQVLASLRSWLVRLCG
jgi:hypothetical protein